MKLTEKEKELIEITRDFQKTAPASKDKFCVYIVELLESLLFTNR